MENYPTKYDSLIYKINPKFYMGRINSFELKNNGSSVNKWSHHNEIKGFANSALTVFDVAAYIVNKLGPISTMKLHKLIYYCQAWSLIWDEKILFPENIEAWANGPVIRELFNFHRGHFQISRVDIGNPDKIDDIQKATIDSILDYYGNRPAQWLIDLTHSEDPWRNAREGLSQLERGNNIITLESMADYYSSL